MKPQSPDLSYAYKVVDKDGNHWGIDKEELAEFLKHPDYEVLHYYYTSVVTVDGVDYYQDRYNSICTPTFYTLREDVTHVPDRDIRFDSAAQYRTTCSFCTKPWQMHETDFLKNGVIRCAHCGRRGSVLGSVW